MDHTTLFGLVLYTVAATLGGSLAIGFGMPRLWFAAVIGAALPFVPAFLAAYVASILGSVITFALLRTKFCARWAERLRNHPKMPKFVNADPGFSGTLLIRQAPIPGVVVSAALAASNVKFGAYTAATAVGYLPMTILVVLAASGIRQIGSNDPLYAIIGCVVLALIGLLVRQMKREKIASA